jgi:hypothetical protein
MKRTVIAILTLSVAAFGSMAAFIAVTGRRIANMRLTQYAWDSADTTPVGIE